jgi:site-specific DNA recombinase
MTSVLRHYLGIVTYQGVEYPGRHQPLITEELFERVQQVLERMSEGHTRMRTHHHYLKGLLWCGRCQKRLIVQKARSRRGGEYYYFFCIGRQKGTCDLPYLPVETLEEAVVRHYGEAVLLPEEVRAQIRTGVDGAVTDNYQLTASMREEYVRRLDKLDAKESYLLDLAAEEGWPKDKLKAKIDGIRRERKEIRATLDQAETQMDNGRQVFRDALTLLEEPQAMYERGDETVRSILNKAFFTKLYVDGHKIAGHQPREPFDVLAEAYQVYRTNRASKTYCRRDVTVATTSSAALTSEYGAAATFDRETLIDSLSLALAGQGSSKSVMVELTRLELVTPCLQSEGTMSARVHHRRSPS